MHLITSTKSELVCDPAVGRSSGTLPTSVQTLVFAPFFRIFLDPENFKVRAHMRVRVRCKCGVCRLCASKLYLIKKITHKIFFSSRDYAGHRTTVRTMPTTHHNSMSTIWDLLSIVHRHFHYISFLYKLHYQETSYYFFSWGQCGENRTYIQNKCLMELLIGLLVHLCEDSFFFLVYVCAYADWPINNSLLFKSWIVYISIVFSIYKVSGRNLVPLLFIIIIIIIFKTESALGKIRILQCQIVLR